MGLVPTQRYALKLLADELQRVKDQADFTEKLLTERAGAEPENPGGADAPD
ncbi:hypothetical protein ACFL5A_00320 [Gemmatimonadota bacterium]